MGFLNFVAWSWVRLGPLLSIWKIIPFSEDGWLNWPQENT